MKCIIPDFEASSGAGPELGVDEKCWPHTADAGVWARECCRRNRAADEAVMLQWFTSAITAGYACRDGQAQKFPV